MAHYTVMNTLQDGTRLDSMEGFILSEEFSEKIIAVLLSSKEKRNEKANYQERVEV